MVIKVPGLTWAQDMLDALLSDAQAWAKSWGVGAILTKMGQGHFDGVIRDTRSHAATMRRIGFSAFRSRWAYVRQLLPLQSRLLVEQILWAMGPPWRSLLTGFNPIELGAVGVLVPFKEETLEKEINVEEGLPGSGTVITPPPGGMPPGGGPGGGIFQPAYKKRWKWTR